MADIAKVGFKEFCQKVYRETWEREFQKESFGQTTQSAIQAARLTAQRKAIDKALVEALLKYSPDVSESEIWKEIGMTNKVNVAQLGSF